MDLTLEHEVTRAFSWVEENHGGVDVLVNNAGLGGVTPLLGNYSSFIQIKYSFLRLFYESEDLSTLFFLILWIT